jgi:hypothetical protein
MIQLVVVSPCEIDDGVVCGGSAGVSAVICGEREAGSDKFDRPSGTLFDALGVVGELGVEELNQAIGFVWSRDDRDLVAQNLEAVVPLLANEAAFARRGRDEAIDGSAVGGGGRHFFFRLWSFIRMRSQTPHLREA